MRVIGVPETHNQGNPRFAIADLILHSLTEFNLQLLEKLPA
jgi:hypothetical protein